MDKIQNNDTYGLKRLKSNSYPDFILHFVDWKIHLQFLLYILIRRSLNIYFNIFIIAPGDKLLYID